MTRFAATLSWKSWRREERQSSTLSPAVNVRMYVPSCFIMNGSGVSVLEICRAIPLDEGFRTGQRRRRHLLGRTTGDNEPDGFEFKEILPLGMRGLQGSGRGRMARRMSCKR